MSDPLRDRAIDEDYRDTVARVADNLSAAAVTADPLITEARERAKVAREFSLCPLLADSVDALAAALVVERQARQDAETALRLIVETCGWYAANGDRLPREVDHALCVEVLDYAERAVDALAAAGSGDTETTP